MNGIPLTMESFNNRKERQMIEFNMPQFAQQVNTFGVRFWGLAGLTKWPLAWLRPLRKHSREPPQIVRAKIILQDYLELCSGVTAQQLRSRIQTAHSISELIHLRACCYDIVSRQQHQKMAEHMLVDFDKAMFSIAHPNE